MVAPDLAGHGLGRWLLAFAEGQAPAESSGWSCSPAPPAARNLAMYERGRLPAA